MTEPAEAPMPAGLSEPPAGYAAWLAEVKVFAQAWGDAEIVQQLVGRLPWGHNQLVEALPAELQTSLPSIEQIERELGSIDNNEPNEAP